MSSWSPELRVLRDPAETFRDVVSAPSRGAWTLLRRPLFLLFAMGMALSLHSAGRLSVRVVLDGMVSFAFLPVFEVIAVGLVYLRGDRRLPFARVADAFFVSNAPWFLWLLGFCLWRFTQTALEASAWSLSTFSIVRASLLVPILWSAYLDLQFFRSVLPRSSGGPLADLVVARGVAWAGALGYFFGIAAWAQLVAWAN
jgi:hypothetical protein